MVLHTFLGVSGSQFEFVEDLDEAVELELGKLGDVLGEAALGIGELHEQVDDLG
jgi:hypothetical protein